MTAGEKALFAAVFAQALLGGKYPREAARMATIAVKAALSCAAAKVDVVDYEPTETEVLAYLNEMRV